MRACPKCKSSEYNNKTFVLMINECGHSLCKNCVDNLFVRQSAPCPTCGRTLKKSAFWEQIFDDPLVAKEVHIRKKLQKIFNLKEDDFPDLRAFNDYLERIESYVFNLTNEVDVEETKRSIDDFQRQYEDLIVKNRNRRSKDEEWIQSILAEEAHQKMRPDGPTGKIDSEPAGQEKKGENEMRALMAEFMSSDMPAEFIVNDKKRQQYVAKMAAEQEKQRSDTGATAARSVQQRTQIQNDQKQQVVPLAKFSEGEQFVYEPVTLDLDGPAVPPIEELGSRGYLKHIRAASTWQLAGGYHESLGCYRAIMDAHCGLF